MTTQKRAVKREGLTAVEDARWHFVPHGPLQRKLDAAILAPAMKLCDDLNWPNDVSIEFR
jgi:hypothetical protein